jgi:hypothetical protein
MFRRTVYVLVVAAVVLGSSFAWAAGPAIEYTVWTADRGVAASQWIGQTMKANGSEFGKVDFYFRDATRLADDATVVFELHKANIRKTLAGDLAVRLEGDAIAHIGVPAAQIKDACASLPKYDSARGEEEGVWISIPISGKWNNGDDYAIIAKVEGGGNFALGIAANWLLIDKPKFEGGVGIESADGGNTWVVQDWNYMFKFYN